MWMSSTPFEPGLELPAAVADPLLVGDNGGIVQLFDLAYGGSWVKQANPSTGDVIEDMSPRNNDLTTAFNSSNQVVFAGGGFDFAATTAGMPYAVRADVGKAPLATIHAAAYDYFLVCGYYRLPAAWNAAPTIQVIFSTSSVYNADPDLLSFGMAAAGSSFTFRRQTSGSTRVEVNLPAVPAAYLGKVAQIAFLRTAAGTYGHIRTSAGIVSATGPAGVDNAGDYSANRPMWGAAANLADLSAGGRRDIRVYRGFISDLNTDPRDPIQTLADDWARVASRFS